MNEEEINTYQDLKDIELKVRKLAGSNYISWSDVWEKVLEYDSYANFLVHETEKGVPAFINSTGGLVKVTVKIKEIERTQWLSIMRGYGHKSIPKDEITSNDIQNSIQRCLVKCIALFGLGLFVYQGEDLPRKRKGK